MNWNLSDRQQRERLFYDEFSRLRRVMPALDTGRASRLERLDYLLMKALPATRQRGGEVVLAMHKAGSVA